MTGHLSPLQSYSLSGVRAALAKYIYVCICSPFCIAPHLVFFFMYLRPVICIASLNLESPLRDVYEFTALLEKSLYKSEFFCRTT